MKVLGYKGSMSQKFIEKSYGSIESMVLTRLNVSKNDAHNALLSLKKKQHQRNDTDSSLLKKAIIRAAVIPFLSNEKIKMIAASMNIDVNDIDVIKASINQYVTTFDLQYLYE